MSHRSLLLAAFLSVVTVAAHAADTESTNTASLPLHSDVERSQIKTERERAEAFHRLGVAECYALFAVTDCIQQLRRQRREVLDSLHRQEVAINASDRQRKAQERVESAIQKENAAVKSTPSQPRAALKTQN